MILFFIDISLLILYDVYVTFEKIGKNIQFCGNLISGLAYYEKFRGNLILQIAHFREFRGNLISQI